MRALIDWFDRQEVRLKWKILFLVSCVGLLVFSVGMLFIPAWQGVVICCLGMVITYFMCWLVLRK